MMQIFKNLTNLLAWVFLFSNAASAQTNDANTSRANNFDVCIQEFAGGRVIAGVAERYSGRLMTEALQACTAHISPTAAQGSPAEQALATTRLYVQTLALLNELPREQSGSAMIKGQSLIAPAEAGPRAIERMRTIDRTARSDLNLIYLPTYQCLGTIAGEGPELAELTQVHEALAEAGRVCESSRALARTEADRILLADGYPGDQLDCLKSQALGVMWSLTVFQTARLRNVPIDRTRQEGAGGSQDALKRLFAPPCMDQQ